MKTFEYLVADNLDAAVAEYGAGKSMLKAGGIDLIDRLKERLELPDSIVSIGGIGALNYIKQDGDAIKIGCNTTLADIGRSDVLKKAFPGLHEACASAATPQIRERATLGGNICQRPRCWYFRNYDIHCLKKGGDTCFSADGENEYHAIFGDGPCHIVHPSNAAPSLVAVDALITVKNGKGERQIKARDFFVMPDKNLYAENVLGPDEIVTEVTIPKAPEKSAWLEIREKQSYDWPLVAAAVVRNGGAWQVCLGAVAPVPWYSEAASKVLGSSEMTAELAAKAGEAAVEGAKPMEHNAYKIQLVKVAVKRAALMAAGMEAIA